MDFLSDCVFLDESGFHINMRRSVGWSRRGRDPVAVTPTTRAKMTTIVGVISAAGVIRVCFRLPQLTKKRKLARGEAILKGTVTGHYVSFIKATLDEMDRHPQLKGHYLVMDNAPIHTNRDIGRHLPPYSPELNPIEQVWAVVKSKVKRSQFTTEETLMTRIAGAYDALHLSDFIRFVQHSNLATKIFFKGGYRKRGLIF